MEALQNTHLEKELENIRGSKGDRLEFSDIEMLIQAMINSTEINDPHNGQIIAELTSVQKEIKELKDNLSQSASSSDAHDLIVLSTNDLADVLKIQEQSTNEILDKAELIMKLLQDNADAPKEEILDAVMQICEKCNFQDLSGQRIQRVVKNLNNLENIVCTVLRVLMGADVVKNSIKFEKPKQSSNDSLMNGPQSLEQAPSQEDIDNMFG